MCVWEGEGNVGHSREIYEGGCDRGELSVLQCAAMQCVAVR